MSAPSAETVVARARETPPRRLQRRIAREWRQLREAGNDYRVQRVVRLASILALIGPAFVLSVVLRLIDAVRGFRIIRLSEKGRITIMLSYVEPYVRKLRMEEGPAPLIVVLNPGASPNEQLTKMYRRSVWLIDDDRPWLRSLLLTAVRFFLPRSKLLVPSDIGLRAHSREFAEAWQRGEPVLRFTPEEEATGRRLVREIGIPDGASYVCLGLRESAYYQQFVMPGARARHLNTEANEDTYVRNPPLCNYLAMAEACAARGLYVLRMGQTPGKALPSGLHPNVIDYATKQRTPFGDIYLLATCLFVVSGGAAGLWQVTSAFNRPVVLTDSYWLQFRPLREGDLFIPSKMWVVAEKRFLTFREMLASYIRYSYASHCRRDGIELVHNTPDEIAAVVLEMEQRLAGTWAPQEEDQELQRRFDALYLPGPYGYGLPGAYGYGMPGRIGAEFLRQNRDLL